MIVAATAESSTAKHLERMEFVESHGGVELKDDENLPSGDRPRCGAPIDRRQFVAGASAILAGASLAPFAWSVEPQAAERTTRAVDDPSIEHGIVALRRGDAQIDGYLARPKREGTFPGVVFIPGNWLIEPYIGEFAAQLAVSGFAALAVDVYNQFPKMKTWEEAHAFPWETTQKIIREKWTDEGMLKDVMAGVEYLREQEYVSPKKVGMSGFCGGGWNAILFTVDNPDLVAAVVPFYAPPDAAERFNLPRSVLSVIDKLAVPLQAHYGTRDKNFTMEDVDRFRAAVSKLDVETEVHLYDADHGFMAYNREGMYEPESAKLALARMVEFLHRHVK